MGSKQATPMDKEAAARIQSAADKDRDCASADTAFDRRAQSAADKNEAGDTRRDP
ncbi:hypothetical protein Aple_081280 [Acrocarpospora pleiomorpha]|uniref:SMP domain-containing protein n=1 Tax=Acrocarpospora pleiomorpha TaxID=90975 RepID=A0A5M3XZ49_9ACTN|nr:hypothetical protein [Acrocarpospora pleiomorpha]GES25229.1 hypothetical protein Aple_081280 [Acrocarpospora pleiomorpha]